LLIFLMVSGLILFIKLQSTTPDLRTSTNTPTKSTAPASTPSKTSTTAPTKTTNTVASKPASATSTTPVNSSQAKPGVSQTDKYIEERKKLQEQEAQALLQVKTKQPEKPEFQNFGIDSELAKKAADNYSPGLEKEAREWMEAVTGEKLTGTFAEVLKSGVVLCTLINTIKPDNIQKINKAKMPFVMMENINNFIAAATALGVPQQDCFMTVDLFEEKNMNQVILAIQSLGRQCRKVSGYNGPSIGPKLSDKHEVNFTEEQLKKGQGELTFSQQRQADSQKLSSDAFRLEHSVVKTNETGTTTAHLGLLDKDKSSVQKEASAARKQGHNIIKDNSK